MSLLSEGEVLGAINFNKMDTVKIKKTPLNGNGLFATKSFKKGETVLVGRIIKELDANHSHASQIDRDRFILHDELTRTANHSCDPNCGIKVNETGAHNYIAMSDIAAEEEITFDYTMRNYKIEHFPAKCECGSKNCIGKITGWKDLPSSKKRKYHDWAAPYLLELDMVNLIS